MRHKLAALWAKIRWISRDRAPGEKLVWTHDPEIRRLAARVPKKVGR